MSELIRFEKDPNAVLDYTFDWSAWLGDDTISTSTWIVPAGITKASSSNTATTTTIWLSGGRQTAKYLVTNRIVTANGRTEDRTAEFTITNQ